MVVYLCNARVVSGSGKPLNARGPWSYDWGPCKPPLLGGNINRHRPTLPRFTAIPSALAGLTSLFGMGRGRHRRYRHLNVFSVGFREPFLTHRAFEAYQSHNNDILLKEVLFGEDNVLPVESIGQLVPLGYAVASFTPMAYQRGHLPRSSMEISSCG